MHIRLVLLIAMASTFTFGCGLSEDPVSEFKVIAPRFIPELNKVYKDAIAQGAVASRMPEIIEMTSIGFVERSAKLDVKKTDSMISPYKGVIECEASFQYSGLVGEGLGVFTFDFVFQDGKWVPTGGMLTRGKTVSGADISGTIRISPRAMQSAMDRINSRPVPSPSHDESNESGTPIRERVSGAVPKRAQPSAPALANQPPSSSVVVPTKALANGHSEELRQAKAQLATAEARLRLEKTRGGSGEAVEAAAQEVARLSKMVVELAKAEPDDSEVKAAGFALPGNGNESAESLYDRAVTLKSSNPAKSLDLLQEVEKRARDDTLFQKAFALTNKVKSNPESLYLLAVKYKSSDPEKARAFLNSAWQSQPSEDLQSKLKFLQAELGMPVEESDNLADQDPRMRTIFKDWAKQRGDALKNARKMTRARGDAYIKSVDQRLVRDLTRKYGITHEELDRIEAYGAEHNWW
jgi:hypothetical protein